MFTSLLPDPLHPAMVHLPIALSVLAPIVAVGGLMALRRNIPIRWAWGSVVALLAALSLSAFIAKQTGETDEEIVEDAVSGAALEAHEESADRFMVLSLIVLAAGVTGLSSGAIGKTARLATVAGACLMVAAGWQVGHQGGQLVYRDGAASAHVARVPGQGPMGNAGETEDD